MNPHPRCLLARVLVCAALAALVHPSRTQLAAQPERGRNRPQSEDFNPTGATRYRWEQVPGESLALIGPFGVLCHLHFGERNSKPHFHPLATADGRSLTWSSPPDHPWHYGLWHSWKLINGVNYWEEDRSSRQPEGITRVIQRNVIYADQRGAQVRLHLEYAPRSRPADVALDETLVLSIGMPGEDGTYRIDWVQQSRARQSVILDRTPPPRGGYAGLSIRGSPFLRDANVLAASGSAGMALHHERSPWATLTGTLNGKAAGITLMDHPANPRHPTPWFVVLTESLPRWGAVPFWYLNSALLDQAPLRIEPGARLALAYRIRVDPEAPRVPALEEEFRDFAAQSPFASP